MQKEFKGGNSNLSTDWVNKNTLLFHRRWSEAHIDTIFIDDASCSEAALEILIKESKLHCQEDKRQTSGVSGFEPN